MKETSGSLEFGASHLTTAPQNVSLMEASASAIYSQLRNDIVLGKLKPNDRLRFDKLRQDYSAGIGTLREALSHLVSDGLVHSEVGRGYCVAPISAADLKDVTNWRVEFETRAAVDSARNGDNQWEGRVVSSFHILSRTPTPSVDSAPEVWIEAGERHEQFHDALVSACTSPWLLYFRELLLAQGNRYRALATMGAGSVAHRNFDEHKAIMDAALDRDEKKLSELIEEHIRRTADTVLTLLSESNGDSSEPAYSPPKRRRRVNS